MKYILRFFAFLFVFSLYTRRFRNSYKLIFIFGKKGAGKSTLMVKEMLKHAKKGWTIYTDMQDCNVPGIRIISALDLAKFAPEPHSCLFLEEVGITYDNRKYKEFGDGVRDFWKFLRKYKCKAYMNSQSYDIDKKIRDVVDGMILQNSIADVISISRPIRRSVTLTEPSADSESRIADRLSFAPIWDWKFMWMPRYHKYFDSFSAPPRDPIPFRQIPGDISDLRRSRSALRTLRRTLSKSRNEFDDDFTTPPAPGEEPLIEHPMFTDDIHPLP